MRGCWEASAVSGHGQDTQYSDSGTESTFEFQNRRVISRLAVILLSLPIMTLPHGILNGLCKNYYLCIIFVIPLCSKSWMDRNFIHSFHSLSCDRSTASSKGGFSTECELMLSLSTSNILSFPRRHTIATYIFFSSSCHFPLSFLQESVLEGRSYTRWPIQLAFLLFIVSRIFQSYL